MKHVDPVATGPWLWALAVIAAAVLVAPACGDGGGSPEAGRLRAPIGPGAPGWVRQDDASPVVARVGPVEITLAELQRRVDAEAPGASPAEVLDRLIAWEVLAQEAARRGFVQDHEVRTESRRAMVRVLLEESFEPDTTTDKVPAETLEEAFRSNYWYFNNPDTVSASHLLFKVKKRAPEETWEARRREAEQARSRLVAVPLKDKEDFRQRSEALASDHADLNLADLGAFAHKGRFVKPFSDAAFALGDGELSQPVRTQYGWHLIYRYAFKPARSVTMDDVRDEVMERVWPEWRRYRFYRYLEEAKSRARIETFPNRLETLDATQPSPQ